MLLLSWCHFLQHVPFKLCRGGVQSWWYRTGFCFSLKTGRTRLRTILTDSLQGSLRLWSNLYVSLKWSGELLKDCKVQVCSGPLAQWSGSSRADSHLCCNACRRGHPIYHCFFTPAFSAVGEVSLSGHKQTKDFPHRQHACIPSYHQARDLLWDYVVATDSGPH